MSGAPISEILGKQKGLFSAGFRPDLGVRTAYWGLLRRNGCINLGWGRLTWVLARWRGGISARVCAGFSDTAGSGIGTVIRSFCLTPFGHRFAL